MRINNHVTWVGINDSSQREYHGDAYVTPKGTSYNAYLIRDQKTALIDTVFTKHSHAFIEKLEKLINLNTIDYIILQHGEIDHSGALIDLLKKIPHTPIYCTEECMYTLKGHYKQDFNFVTVKTGDILDLGKRKLMFFEMKMLHWPDNMMTYLMEDRILFSNDLYSQHVTASKHLTKQEVIQEAMKFYANVFSPFSRLYAAKQEQIRNYKLKIKTICPGHGQIWKDTEIIDRYDQWSHDYKEKQITIIYDSYWGGTKTLADNIAEGILVEDHSMIVKTIKITDYDAHDLIFEVFKSTAILIGSPTINNTYTSAIAALLNDLEGLRFHNKKAATFGCYGWSGEAVMQMKDFLSHAGFVCLKKSLTCLWRPDDKMAFEAHLFGKNLAKKCQN